MWDSVLPKTYGVLVAVVSHSSFGRIVIIQRRQSEHLLTTTGSYRLCRRMISELGTIHIFHSYWKHPNSVTSRHRVSRNYYAICWKNCGVVQSLHLVGEVVEYTACFYLSNVRARGARTRRFITAFTTGRHRFLYWASRIQSTPPPASLPKIHSDPILPSAPWFSKWPLFSCFYHQTFLNLYNFFTIEHSLLNFYSSFYTEIFFMWFPQISQTSLKQRIKLCKTLVRVPVEIASVSDRIAVLVP
jgi:hypothetical protein